MIDPSDWAQCFARQAEADFRAWDLYQAHPEAVAEECHALLFLQMAREKWCKAYLILAGTSPDVLQSSHGYIAGPLPRILQEQILFVGADLGRKGKTLKDIRHIASEIELLSPAVDRDGRRPENCEYPWKAGDSSVASPLDWSFYPSSLLTASSGKEFVTLLRGAIARILEETR